VWHSRFIESNRCLSFVETTLHQVRPPLYTTTTPDEHASKTLQESFSVPFSTTPPKLQKHHNRHHGSILLPPLPSPGKHPLLRRLLAPNPRQIHTIHVRLPEHPATRRWLHDSNAGAGHGRDARQHAFVRESACEADRLFVVWRCTGGWDLLDGEYCVLRCCEDGLREEGLNAR
jgi:hypothetical protein